MRLYPEDPPPGPFQRDFWRSPLRGPWLTATLGALLLPLVSIVAITGLLSHSAYEPALGNNGLVDGAIDIWPWAWPVGPVWLYALNQGLHVTVGFIAVPLLLAKLWSVIPRLFVWPPAVSPAQAIERLSIALLVGSALFQFATGIANAQNWYPFKFNFLVAHYWVGWVFIGAIALHVLIKLPRMRRAWADRGVLEPLKASLADTRADPGDDELISPEPSVATVSRRGMLAGVGGAMSLIGLLTVPQWLGGPVRPLALFLPRGTEGDGPNGFPVNKTAKKAGITAPMVGAGYRLVLQGPGGERELSRTDLLALQQREERLPIACVEGWTSTQRWTGVPLPVLAALVGGGDAETCRVVSLQPRGVLREATLNKNQHRADNALLALKVNGVDLSADHGYPARIIVPALPGVHNTKWVSTMVFA